MPEKQHLASAALHCEWSMSGQHRATLRPGPATQHEGRRLQMEPALAQGRKIQIREIFFKNLHYHGWILSEVLKTVSSFIIRHWKYEYFAQAPRLGHCWPVAVQVPFLIVNSLSDHIQLEKAWFMLCMLGSSLSSYKKVYKHVLTAPHSLQSSIWFTAVHKSQEQRALGSAQTPAPAQGGAIGSAAPAQLWLWPHKAPLLCCDHTSSHFLIKGSCVAQMCFALHELTLIFLTNISSF